MEPEGILSSLQDIAAAHCSPNLSLPIHSKVLNVISPFKSSDNPNACIVSPIMLRLNVLSRSVFLLFYYRTIIWWVTFI
jgi:hypothetical protein